MIFKRYQARIAELLRLAIKHDGLRKYGTNMSWLFAEKIFRMLIGFTVGIYVARQLGPTQYGILNYAISIVAIFSIAAGLGLDSIVVRELVKYPEKRNKILGSTFILKLTGFLVMLAGIGITLYFKNDDQTKNLIILVIAAGYLFQVFQTIDFYFQSQVLSKYVAISQVVAWVLVSFGRAFCAWKGYPLIYFAWLEAINMGLMSLGYLFFYMIKISNPFNWHFDFRIAKELLKNSWPFFLSGATGMIYMRIDQVMIGSMLGDMEVGYYAVAVRLSEIWYFFPMIISATLLPAIIRSREVSNAHYMKRLQKYYYFMIWTSIFLCLGMNVVSYHLITILYGNEYAPAVIVLIIYMWELVVMAMGVPFANWIIAENMQIYALIFSIIGAIVNIVLNYFLIKGIGINGAAIATVIAPLSAFIIVGCLNKRTRQQLYMVIRAFLLVDLFKILLCKRKAEDFDV